MSTDLTWRQIAATKQGGFYEFKPMYVSTLPIPLMPTNKQKSIEQLVEQILSAKQRDTSVDVQGLEQEIDQLVYKLCGLTKEETEIVEES